MTTPVVAKDVTVLPGEKGKRLGHLVRHVTARSVLHLTPVLSLPIPNHNDGTPLKVCPTCQVNHPVKTLHLWVDDTGATLVSGGVLELLKKAQPSMDGFTQEGSTDNPPPLKIGAGQGRPEMDYANRAQVIYSAPR